MYYQGNFEMGRNAERVAEGECTLSYVRRFFLTQLPSIDLYLSLVRWNECVI